MLVSGRGVSGWPLGRERQLHMAGATLLSGSPLGGTPAVQTELQGGQQDHAATLGRVGVGCHHRRDTEKPPACELQSCQGLGSAREAEARLRHVKAMPGSQRTFQETQPGGRRHCHRLWVERSASHGKEHTRDRRSPCSRLKETQRATDASPPSCFHEVSGGCPRQRRDR